MKNLLQSEIEAKIGTLSKMDASSKEYSEAVENVTKLMDRELEIEKIEKSAAQTEKQIRENQKDRITKGAIDIGSVVLPLMVTVWGACVSLKFEETGSITTTIGRKFLDKLIKK